MFCAPASGTGNAVNGRGGPGRGDRFETCDYYVGRATTTFKADVHSGDCWSKLFWNGDNWNYLFTVGGSGMAGIGPTHDVADQSNSLLGHAGSRLCGQCHDVLQ